MNRLLVESAPPFATVQDLGRPGHRAQGVPPSGAMDPDALALANVLARNPPDAAGIEWALGPGQLRVEGRCRIAVAGVSASHNGKAVDPWTAWTAEPGDEIALAVPDGVRFGYLAVTGGVEVPRVLASRSTYLPGRFGGVAGRILRSGDALPVAFADATPPVTLPRDLVPDRLAPIRLLTGPQGALFADDAWDALLTGSYTVSRASDRMGMRLDGPALMHRGPPALPSECVCPGAIQVPGGGAPIILMPDGPTVGGYPKLAVVVTADLGRLAQLGPGTRLRFIRADMDAARAALRERHQRWTSAAAAIQRESGR